LVIENLGCVTTFAKESLKRAKKINAEDVIGSVESGNTFAMAA